ncbi:MAG: M20 family metallopeptidase [Chloroflexota bacterium]|nr:M20 family metallopeptidase [Chloroflexota bacterium]
MTTQHATSPMSELLSAATTSLSDVVAVRRRLHARPEIGLHLPATQAVVVEELRNLRLEPVLGKSVSSVTAVIPGARPGPTVLLRADMDALPLQEDTGLDFASEVPGVMHACGHDTHVAMLLGAARLLVERRERLAGSVLLMFQPGEEGFHGARFMLEEGLLERAPSKIVGAYGLHIATRYESGTIAIRPGALLAAGDTIRITVRGRGGHASAPHLAADPITVAAEIIVALQVAVTREIHAFDPVVITIANVVAGTTTNIIPETAFIAGTMRTVSDEARDAGRALVRRVAPAIAAAHGLAADVEIEPGYPVTFNDPAATEFVRDTVRELAGEDVLRSMDHPIMGAEDFSYVLQRVPGAFAFIGARPAHEDPVTAPQNHSNRVVFEEGPMALGAALYAALALRNLAG